jgi:hypothetical protein
MIHREWRLSYSFTRGEKYDPNNNWWVVLYENSALHNTVEVAGDRLCALTGHRWCNRIYGPISDWAMNRENEVLRIPITRGSAESLDRVFVDRMDSQIEETV